MSEHVFPLDVQAEEDWAGAAAVLSQIPLTSSQRNISDEYKVIDAHIFLRLSSQAFLQISCIC
jgi:hypothetical protein